MTTDPPSGHSGDEQPADLVAGGLSRRQALTAAAAGTAGAVLASAPARAAARRPAGAATGDPLLRQLDAKIRRASRELRIPGVAVGVIYRGREYVKGYGVTNVDYPVAVDGDTLFRIGSTTKTFTGTTLMRLVDQGRMNLDAPVRSYLPDFATADAATAARVTVRQLLNHSSGWWGDDVEGFGRGDDAIARYVASMTRLPQLTPLGRVFAYNNAGLVVAGRLIEVVTGATYESAVRELLLDRLGLAHTRFFSDEIIGYNVAASHIVEKGRAVVDPSLWAFPRSCDPTGGLISSVRDQLRYARFHLGDGRARNGQRLLTRRTLVAMRSNPGPGGTLVVELDGMGVTWMLRPSAQGVRIVQHGGNWPSQASGFMMVPSRGFAMTLLTNSEGGPALTSALFDDDWALRRFAGVSNLPAKPRRLSRPELAAYAGSYLSDDIGVDGQVGHRSIEFRPHNGRLRGIRKAGGQTQPFALAFYRPDYVLDLDEQGRPTGARSDFVRGADSKVAWFRTHGRLWRRQGRP